MVKYSKRDVLLKCRPSSATHLTFRMSTMGPWHQKGMKLDDRMRNIEIKCNHGGWDTRMKPQSASSCPSVMKAWHKWCCGLARSISKLIHAMFHIISHRISYREKREREKNLLNNRKIEIFSLLPWKFSSHSLPFFTPELMTVVVSVLSTRPKIEDYWSLKNL